jgi:hypothetical protein
MGAAGCKLLLSQWAAGCNPQGRVYCMVYWCMYVSDTKAGFIAHAWISEYMICHGACL